MKDAMSRPGMNLDEIDAGLLLVRKLLGTQFPR
jgi:hypothetical protein